MTGNITEYIDHTQITNRPDSQVLEPEAFFFGWFNFTCQQEIRAIAVAPRSRHIWMATWGGVLSWNRREELLYRRYSSEHGLANNQAACVCVDEAEMPWVGHTDGGLSFFDKSNWRVHADLQNASVQLLTSAGVSGGIWAAVLDLNSGEPGLYRIPAPDQPAILVAVGLQALALLADGDELLLGNASGLFRIRVGQPPVPVAASLIKHCSALAGSGQVWAAGYQKIYQLQAGEPAKEINVPYLGQSPNQVLALAAVRDQLWVLTAQALLKLAGGNWKQVEWNSALPDETPPKIYCLAASADGAYAWLGTNQNLAGVLSRENVPAQWDLRLLTLHAEDSLSNLNYCLAADGGTMRAGTVTGLLSFGVGNQFELDGNCGAVRSLVSAADNLWLLALPNGLGSWKNGQPDFSGPQPDGLPLALALDENDCPALVTANGVWWLDLFGQPRFLRAPTIQPVRSLLWFGGWWLGTGQGVYQLVGTGWRLEGEQPGPQQSDISALVKIDGGLWVASSSGLWQRDQGHWVEHSGACLAQDPGIRAVAAASSHRLWVARADGVALYDPHSQAVLKCHTPQNSGLGSSRVTALLEDQGSLWVATTAGISRLNL